MVLLKGVDTVVAICWILSKTQEIKISASIFFSIRFFLDNIL